MNPTIRAVRIFLNARPQTQATLHDIVNHFLPTPILDGSQFSPPSQYRGSEYFKMLLRVEYVCRANDLYLDIAGDQIALTDSPAFNRRIARTIVL